jgi:hypothetical protein
MVAKITIHPSSSEHCGLISKGVDSLAEVDIDGGLMAWDVPQVTKMHAKLIKRAPIGSTKKFIETNSLNCCSQSTSTLQACVEHRD